jgi:hypothetical protein
MYVCVRVCVYVCVYVCVCVRSRYLLALIQSTPYLGTIRRIFGVVRNLYQLCCREKETL